jgi:hypothetical protein
VRVATLYRGVPVPVEVEAAEAPPRRHTPEVQGFLADMAASARTDSEGEAVVLVASAAVLAAV